MKIYKIWDENKKYSTHEIFDKINEIAQFSRDPHTRVGCALTNDSGNILLMGYNDYPENMLIIPQERKERPEKYKWIEHAERNVLFTAARLGISTSGLTMHQNLCPCTECARAIVHSGLKRVVTHRPDLDNEAVQRWHEDMKRSLEMFSETNVEIVFTEDMDIETPILNVFGKCHPIITDENEISEAIKSLNY